MANKSDVLRYLSSARLAQRDPGANTGATAKLYSTKTTNLSGGASDWLPNPGVRSLDLYAEDLWRKLSRADFGIIVNQVQALDFDLWDRSRYFLDDVFRNIGFPCGYSDLVLFVARYRHSPLGLHKDSVDVFCHVLAGRKKIRLWPFEAFFDKTGSGPVAIGQTVSLSHIDYTKHLDGSIVLEGGPGDILYWPSRYWHVGEGNAGEMTVSLHQTVNLEVDLSHGFARVLGEFIEKNLRKPGTFEVMTPHRGGLPPQIRGLAKKAGEIFPSEIEKAAVHEWLSRKTGYGFRHLPPLQSTTEIHEKTKLKANPDFPILSHAVGSRLLVSACGHVLSLENKPHAKSFVNKLNEGGSFSVGRLRKQFNKVDEFDAVLKDFVRHHFLEVTSGSR